MFKLNKKIISEPTCYKKMMREITFILILLIFSACKNTDKEIEKTNQLSCDVASNIKDEIPLIYNNDYDHVAINTLINDSIHARLAFDTGGRFWWISNEKFTEFGKEYKKKKARSIYFLACGARKSYSVNKKATIKIGNIVEYNDSFEAIDLSFVDYPDYDGIIGIRPFTKNIVELNLKEKSLRILDSIPLGYKETDLHLKGNICLIKMNLYIKDSVLISGLFEIDTGSPYFIELYNYNKSVNLLKRLNKDFFVEERRNDNIKSCFIRADSLSFANIVMKNPLINYYNSHHMWMGILGNQFLRKFSIIFDFKKEKVYFKANSLLKKQIYPNLLGIKVKRKAINNDLRVSALSVGGLSDASGIKLGDIILRVNNLSLKKIPRTQFYSITDSLLTVDKNIALTIKRDNHILLKKILFE